MKFTFKVFLSFSFVFFSFSEVNNSIFPAMMNISPACFENKISKQQMKIGKKLDKKKNQAFLVMSFNMLFNLEHKEALLPNKYHWGNRLPRIIEYLQFVRPDIIGAQELYQDQVNDLMDELADKYAYFGKGRDDGDKKGELSPIFYNKNRFQLLEGKIIYYSNQPDKVSFNSHKVKNIFTYCEFLDLNTKKKFIVLNTHFTFANVQARQYEANYIRKFIKELSNNEAIILTGDFNTFPMRYELNLPFNDGGFVFNTITKDNMENSMDKSSNGHFGPITSTNFSQTEEKVFFGNGIPGVILDFIFVNQNVYVRSHGIDPARINQEFMSDHFPVLADVIIKKN